MKSARSYYHPDTSKFSEMDGEKSGEYVFGCWQAPGELSGPKSVFPISFLQSYQLLFIQTNSVCFLILKNLKCYFANFW